MIGPPTLRDVWEAKQRIRQLIRPTPLVHSAVLSDYLKTPVYLKLETTHDIGAFKVRGAANKILRLSKEEQQKGVTTFSTGNHGLAVSYVAQKLGLKAVICISNRVPEAKVNAIKRYGAELILTGNSQDEAREYCNRLQDESGMTIIPPFDDPDVIAGQGTIGLEILDDLPQVGSVIIPLSGGGLLAGMALALKSVNPHIHVAGVSMERAAVMVESLKLGKPVVLEEQDTLADSLLGGIGENNQYTFTMVQKLMDQTILLSENEIADGMVFLLEQHHMAVEGAAATTVGAALQRKFSTTGKPIVLTITGHNVDISVLLDLIKNRS